MKLIMPLRIKGHKYNLKRMTKNKTLYIGLKNLLIKLFPWKIILKNEFLLRKIYSIFFTGYTVFCNVCEKHFSRFIKIQTNDNMCPRCGSLERHRRLWYILNHEIKIHQQDRILDFSPSRVLLKKLSSNYPNYLSTDYHENIQVNKRYDITQLPEPSDSFHWIICYHVLEHIENDTKAMDELYRVLKKDGSVIIQTPFKEGNIYENPGIISSEERTFHFGQEDHVRIYSVNGLKERLETVGFNIKIFEYSADKNNIYGFKPKEFVLIGVK
jgi:SAM-dependent methyltransferase